MLDPRIAQRQAEIEKRKKTTPTSTPTPAAAKPDYTQPAGYTAPKQTPAVSPAPAPKPAQTSTPWYTPAKTTPTGSTGGTTGQSAAQNALAKAEAKAESVYKPNSQSANNEYTTAAQRQQQNKARENYIDRMMKERVAKEYGGWSGNSYGSNTGAAKSGYSQTKATGPNAEIARTTSAGSQKSSVRDLYLAYFKGEEKKQNTDWGTPKTIKDGAQPKTEPNNMQNDWYSISKGPNDETAKTTFIDPRGENAVGKTVDFIKTETDKIKYGVDNMNDTNHTNTVVTKDNVYYQTPKKVENTLTDLQSNISGGITDRKRELEDLQFRQKFAMASGGREEYDRISLEIEKQKADIETLQKIERKIKTGLEFSYQFMANEGEKLSEMSIDDILNSKEEFGENLPYFSPVAKTARGANQGRAEAEKVITVLENTNVASNGKSFTISNGSDAKNSFNVTPSVTKGKNGYYEYSLSVSANDLSKLTPEQQNLYKALDDIPISATAYKALNKTLNAASDIDAAKLGKVSNGLFVAGEVLDVVDFVSVALSDYEDDGELGKDSTKKITAMISSWIGDIAGGASGTAAGATIGTAIMPGIGTVAGSAIGAIVGAYILSNTMEDVGAYLGGLDYGTEHDLEQHIARGR